jgi:hypothetical protein
MQKPVVNQETQSPTLLAAARVLREAMQRLRHRMLQ